MPFFHEEDLLFADEETTLSFNSMELERLKKVLLKQDIVKSDLVILEKIIDALDTYLPM